MRNQMIGKLLFILITASITYTSCKKDIHDRTEEYPSLSPASLDMEAGSWTPVLLTSPDEFPVEAPIAINSPAYTAELNEIKGLQRNLSAEDKKIIKYWSAGGVLRWNEILRELVAKYNLAPYQNDDRSYPAPSAANPFAYPLFPFANPPYAARSYAYVAAAQYDALVAAWHYKKMYNRSAPYKNDSLIRLLIPASELPSYPSEDAVMAGVTIEMLKLLFPGEVAYVQKKAHEQKLYRLLAGSNVRSELEAGETLGRLVAQKFTARGRTDRAGASIGNPAVWKQFEDETTAKGEICWFSLESPKRPPMLPLFSKVKPFLCDSLDIIAMRPPPPPSTTSEDFKKQTEEVMYYSQNPTRERTAIVHFWADGIGTSTPPGHWDAIAADEFVKKNYSEVRWARNYALLNMALMDASIACWDAKYFYFNPRPTQTNPIIKTLTGIPNFPAYTSGHATFSAAAATVLTYLLPESGEKFNDMAWEAAMSRLYGGIHYRVDSEAGFASGKKVGEYAVARAMSDGAD